MRCVGVDVDVDFGCGAVEDHIYRHVPDMVGMGMGWV